MSNDIMTMFCIVPHYLHINCFEIIACAIQEYVMKVLYANKLQVKDIISEQSIFQELICLS
jgi:hypothetical protein